MDSADSSTRDTHQLPVSDHPIATASPSSLAMAVPQFNLSSITTFTNPILSSANPSKTDSKAPLTFISLAKALPRREEQTVKLYIGTLSNSLSNALSPQVHESSNATIVTNATMSPMKLIDPKATPSGAEQTTKCYIVTLSNELKAMIMKDLDEISSACLGVTSKAFYDIHIEIHGAIKLSSGDTEYAENSKMLANYLFNWIPKELRYYNYIGRKFVSKERWNFFVRWWTTEERRYALDLANEILYGLEEDECVEVVDNYMEAALKQGFKYETRPAIGTIDNFESFMDKSYIDKIDEFCSFCSKHDVDPSLAHGDFREIGMELLRDMVERQYGMEEWLQGLYHENDNGKDDDEEDGDEEDDDDEEDGEY